MRDQQDQERLDSPLLQAADAIELDNSYLSPEAQLQWVLEKVEAVQIQ
jgi:cytidylate kinase